MTPYAAGALILAVSLFTPVLVRAAESSGATNSISTNSTTATGPLTTKDAKQALAKAADPKPGPGPGTWRYLSIDFNQDASGTNLAYFTNITFEWHTPGKMILRRTERFDSSTTNFPPHVQVDNEEGSWALHRTVAILFPRPGSKTSGRPVKTPSGGLEWYLDPISLDHSDPELAADVQVTGERLQESGRWLLHITERYGEKSKMRLMRMVKKRIPIYFRPFLKTAELRRMVDEGVPVRYEWALEPDTFSVIVLRGYRSDGQLIFQTQGWQTWTNLPPEAYTIPEDIMRMRPKSLEEANRLDFQVPADR